MTGHLTALGETVQVNTVLIEGQIAVSSVADCGEYLDHNSSSSSPPRGSSLEFNGYVLLIVEKGFFKLGGGGGGWCTLSPPGYPLDGKVNIHMWFTESDIFLWCALY